MSELAIVGTETYTGAFIAGLIRVVDTALEPVTLGRCEFVFDESCGPAAGLSCRETATIFDLSEEREYCARHFQGVNCA